MPFIGCYCEAEVGFIWKNSRQIVFESLVSELDFLKDDENIKSQVIMRYRERFPFAIEGVNNATLKIG